jgi:hypothetical protein
MTQDKTIMLKLCVLTVAVWGAVWMSASNHAPNVVRATSSQSPTVAAHNAANDKLVWLDNYDAALAEAKKTGKPIFSL